MAATVAKQYGAAMPGTSGTPSATNKYVTDADPRLAAVAVLEESVTDLAEEIVSNEELLDLVKWALRRIAFLEAALSIKHGPDDIYVPPAAALVSEDQPWM